MIRKTLKRVAIGAIALGVICTIATVVAGLSVFIMEVREEDVSLLLSSLPLMILIGGWTPLIVMAIIAHFIPAKD